MSRGEAANVSATVDSKTHAPAEPEPFGQLGVRQYVMPALTVLSMIVASAAGLMWSRSQSTVDTFTHVTGHSVLRAHSFYGRLVVAKYTVDPSYRSPREASWEFSQVPLNPNPRDGWRDSWRKRIGVEWRGEPLNAGPLFVGGWWLRIRWPLVLGIAAILPAARFARQIRIRFRAFRARRATAPSPSGRGLG